ncbi:response regulator transcription factor [Cohnella yongneupensis]|uniref:Response regulator n=1 Tax=Cohnella yongneupensis TaxID=425006 RepID=A0ABW0R8Y5_9BACL
MKALIIDDEWHVREAIKLLVPWERFGIHTLLEATDGLSAIELIEAERPAIIFTDMMMPNMNGMELLEWVARHSPSSKVIVISGHDDFAFVRQTLKYGGLDYLLKPIEESQLHGALGRAIEGWKADEEARSSERNRNMEINRLKPVYLDQYFSNLISEPAEHPSIHAMLEQQFAVARPIKEAKVALLSLELGPPSIRAKFAACWDLIYYSLANVCNEFLRAKSAGYAFRYRGQENEIAIVLWDCLDRAESLLSDINEGIYKALNARFGIGIGETVVFPAQLDASYRSARRSIRHRNLLQMKTLVQAHGPHVSEAVAAKSTIFFTDYEQRIRYALQNGDKEQLSSAYEAWFKVLEQSDSVTLEQLHLWWQEFRLARTMWTSDKTGSGGGHLESDEVHMPAVLQENLGFNLAQWKRGFLSETEEIMERLANGDGSTPSAMQAIAKYIEQFLHEELSLQDISNRFFLSREYISRKFKQEMNENLTDYITRVRIEQAKRLLADTQLKISNIAERVGFQDEKYFSKVFKKWTDHSPNEYRKLAFGDSRNG